MNLLLKSWNVDFIGMVGFLEKFCLSQEEPRQKFSEKVDSFHKRSTNSWSKNVKSNANWQIGWKKFDELGEEKK